MSNYSKQQSKGTHLITSLEVKQCKVRCQLRSERQRLLAKPKGLTSVLASRSFTLSSEVVWNSFPELIRKTESVVIFKKKTKDTPIC